MGDLADPETGWNTFRRTIDGYAVINERDTTLLMQQCDWDIDNPTPGAIEDRVDGDVDVAGYLATGSGILASSVYCTVWDAATQKAIDTAAVTLSPSSYSGITNNVNGVYAFPAVSSGFYTVTTTAPGYAQDSRTTTVSSGQLVSIIVALRTQSGEGEGEGEGETGTCSCNSGSKSGAGLPNPADLLMSGFAVLALVMLRSGRR